MSYIFKKCDIVRVKKVVGDDPSLMRENQIVETYQVDLVASGYLFTNHDLILISRSKSNRILIKNGAKNEKA